MKPSWRAVDGIVLLDKPAGLSSNTALQRVRRLFQAEKAGHAGSLDPLATGMLPVCFGQATKLCQFLLDSRKEYRVSARFGESRDTGDAEGQVSGQSDPSGLTEAQLRAAALRFIGEIGQVPPMYSALKHEGRRLYELARAGETVEREARTVTIERLDILRWQSPILEFEVRCSKGTYVRTLVEDLARAVGQAAHVVVLRRTVVSPFDAGGMVTLDQLETDAAGGYTALDRHLRPMLEALAGWTQVELPELQVRQAAQGQTVETRRPLVAGPVALVARGRLLGIGEAQADGRICPRRWLAA